MNDKVFGNLSFDIGWKKKEIITIYGRKYVVTLDVTAYFETDEITDAQKRSYEKFRNEESTLIKEVENKLNEYASDADKKYVPALIKIRRGGELAIAFDDVNDLDDGVVVSVLPDLELMDPNQYF
jgi:hypothetical protein